MKTIKKLIIAFALVFILPLAIKAQQMFHVHEDVVKPSMTMEYETVLKEVLALMKEYPVEGLNVIVFQGSNNHYFYLAPINSMADLDKQSPIAKLAEKAGADKVRALFTRMDKCYDIEKDYIISLNNDLSYMPDGMTQTPEGQNYREQYKIYVTPGNRATVREKMKAIKALFTEKKSKMHYRVYNSGFGTESEYYLVSIAAKDELDMAKNAKDNEEVLGEERQKIMFDLFQNVLNIEEIEGEMRPDLTMKSN